VSRACIGRRRIYLVLARLSCASACACAGLWGWWMARQEREGVRGGKGGMAARLARPAEGLLIALSPSTPCHLFAPAVAPRAFACGMDAAGWRGGSSAPSKALTMKRTSSMMRWASYPRLSSSGTTRRPLGSSTGPSPSLKVCGPLLPQITFLGLFEPL